MKQIILPIALLFCLCAWNSLKAAETEPNNTKAQANTLALNGNNTGAIGNATDVDWWKVTTTGDGKLDVNISISNGLNMWCQIYDNDGNTLLAQNYTSGNVTVSKDGLAAGTYYLKLYPYYNGQQPIYTISNTLTIPAQANDAEPNGTKAQAKVLPLNGSKTGHINYYYNNVKDSVDWYKVTTNADGRLRLTMASANGQNVWAYLFDNDGTTLLAGGYTSGTAVVVNKDGLAAGTYLIRVNTYYTSEWAPYTLADSLFVPTQANDTEPNNTRAQALTLPLNGSVTGHTNYYHNLVKDASDWYKLTTNEDGMITISIQSHNGQNVWAYLYDNDGTTLLTSTYTSSSTSYTFDGLKKGAYYVRINTYYTSEWAPYTLGNTLTTYAKADDASDEPNGYFSQAKTIPANSTITGHVNFYYKNESDTADCHKINYTGTGNLTLVFSQDNRLKYGSAAPTWFRVYKDTNAAPIHSNYYYATSGDINFTGLTQGYYYIKIFTYYNGTGDHFSAYSVKATFTQSNKAKIKIQSYSTPASCSSVNSITYKLSKSHAPYTVQLYRFGIAYGSPLVFNNTKAEFENLPSGSYSATVYGDGATGTAKGKSDTIALMPVPANPNTTAIKSTQAKLNWTSVPCADYYLIQYRVQSAATWNTVSTNGNVANYTLKPLVPSTIYDWRIAAVDSSNGISAISAYTVITSFTTTASGIIAANNDAAADDLNTNSTKGSSLISVSPNPATGYFVIRLNTAVSERIAATLYNANGKAVWSSGSVNATALKSRQVLTNEFGSGVYYLKIINEQGDVIAQTRVSVIK